MTSASSIRILVVEDHSMVRQGIVSILEQQDELHIVAEAKDGMEAIQLHATYQPDITLMDLRMPKLEGVEAIIRIKQHCPEAKIIILTTYDTDEDIYRGLHAGARGYILKDASAEDLIEAIHTVNNGKRFIPPPVAIKLADRLDGIELTDRENQVLKLLCQGNSNSQIATALSISEGTVKFHINNILSKLGVKDRTQAVITALKRGLTRLN